jgi:hypothetical protein
MKPEHKKLDIHKVGGTVVSCHEDFQYREGGIINCFEVLSLEWGIIY